MTKLFFEAMKCLPDELALEGASSVEYGEYVFIIHPSYRPHVYTSERGWKAAKFVNMDEPPKPWNFGS